VTQPPDHPLRDSADRPGPAPARPAGGPDADPPTATIPLTRHDGDDRRSSRRRRVGVISGAGTLLVVAVVVVAAVLATRPDPSDGTDQVASRSVTSAAPSPSRTTAASSHRPSASAKPSHHRATHRSEPPALRAPARLTDKVDWSPFEHTYGAATEPPSGSRSTTGGVTQVRASRSFGAYDGGGLASVTANARYFATAGKARHWYDDECGSGRTTRTVHAGDRACSYVSDVSDGSSGTVILYVQVLRGNVLLQVAPMAFHNGSWSGADLATLRSASVRCASATAAHL